MKMMNYFSTTRTLFLEQNPEYEYFVLPSNILTHISNYHQVLPFLKEQIKEKEDKERNEMTKPTIEIDQMMEKDDEIEEEDDDSDGESDDFSSSDDSDMDDEERK